MTGEEAYARRLALSQGISVPQNPSPAPAPAPAPFPVAETGDEAYQRRLAMSQAMGTPTRAPPIPPAPRVPTPSPEEELPYNPITPPSVTPPPPPPESALPAASSIPQNPDFEERVKHSREAAAAVAARLARLAASQPPETDVATNGGRESSDEKYVDLSFDISFPP